MTASFRLEIDVMVPMRDGTRLATNIWRPEGGEPVPALLVRLPYGKDVLLAIYGPPQPVMSDLLEAGYAVAVQDCRGTFRSGGEFMPLSRLESDDGVDTVGWLAGQTWCDGNVGMYGGSYLGLVQWEVAAAAPAPLKAIAPSITAGDSYRSWLYSPGGALSLEAVLLWSGPMAFQQWLRGVGDGRSDPKDETRFTEALRDFSVLLAHTPVADQPLFEKYLPWIGEVLRHPDRDDYMAAMAPLDAAESITVPALGIGGWYDHFLGEVLRAYTIMRASGANASAREGQRLIIGPWSHVNTRGMFPDRWYGPGGEAAAAGLTGAYLGFFDRWVRGQEDALDGLPPVRIFVMGIDEWRDEQEWPLPDTRYTDFYLTSGGQANTAAGNGLLETSSPGIDEHDTFLYDPRRPVATRGGSGVTLTGFEGPADQRPVEGRDDVLCYSSPVLDAPVEVTGPISLSLHVSTSALDTDFTGKLVDVYPDGRALILCDGIQRLRYRESLADACLAVPGEVYEVTLDLAATSNVFLPGHRIRLEVSSSNFPRYDRNSNTGGVIAMERLDQMIPAVNLVHHGPTHPSRLTLPIIKR
jgi:putative CocE/NonD family hydrolase